MKLSIIIPIYGVELYIKKCLISCFKQDLVLGKDYEIICVNDGTKDRSAEIAKQEISKYKNGITFIDQENRGLSAARNKGLLNANGEYVWFVDSDDWIEVNCLKRIISKLFDNLDILQLQYRCVYDDETLSFDEPFTVIEGIKSGKEVTKMGGLPAPAQFSIFRKDFLIQNNLHFVDGIYHEDSEFKPRAVYLAKKIASDNEVTYFYYQRTFGSIMSSFSVKRAKDILFVNESLYKFTQRIDKKCIPILYRKIGLNMNTLLSGYRKLKSEDKIIVKKMIKNNKLSFDCMMQSRNAKYMIEGFIFKLDLSLGLFLHKMLK